MRDGGKAGRREGGNLPPKAESVRTDVAAAAEREDCRWDHKGDRFMLLSFCYLALRLPAFPPSRFPAFPSSASPSI